METINNIELRDGAVYPDENVLRKVLGKSYNAYTLLLKLYDKYEMSYEWKYYRDGKAWLCKVQKKKKTIVWMSAWQGFMKATIYVPEKYIEEISKIDICDNILKKIKETKNVGKSKPCIFEIKDVAIFDDFTKVMELKIASK